MVGSVALGDGVGHLAGLDACGMQLPRVDL